MSKHRHEMILSIGHALLVVLFLGRIKDPSNLLHVVRNPAFRIMYFSNQFVPSAMARKMMSDAVSRHPPAAQAIG